MLSNIRYTFVLLFACATLSGQGLTENFINLEVGLSFNSLSFEGRTLSLDFSENSARELEYSLARDVSSGDSNTGFFLAVNFGKYKGLTHTVNLDVPIKGTGSGKYGYAIGYSYPMEVGIYHLLLRPSIGVYTGTSSYKLGVIEVDKSGIVIENIEYIDTKVNTTISQSSHTINPKVTITFLTKERFGFWTSIGYNIRIGGSRQKIDFSADNHDTTEFEFSDPYLDFKYDGVRPTDDVFNTSGMSVTFGFSVYYNRD